MFVFQTIGNIYDKLASDSGVITFANDSGVITLVNDSGVSTLTSDSGVSIFTLESLIVLKSCVCNIFWKTENEILKMSAQAS